MATLVVCRDSYVDELGWRIGVAEGDDGNVDVGGFLDGLCVGPWVGNNDEAGFLEGASDIVGEVTWRETTCDGDGSGVCGELEDGALTVRAGGDDTDIGWVINSGDDAGCEDNFLPVGRNGSTDESRMADSLRYWNARAGAAVVAVVA
jgi:hypothetical protein